MKRLVTLLAIGVTALSIALPFTAGAQDAAFTEAEVRRLDKAAGKVTFPPPIYPCGSGAKRTPGNGCGSPPYTGPPGMMPRAIKFACVS